MPYPYYQNPYYQNTQPQSQNNSGFIPVRSEGEARSYPVAYGNSITFKDENAPYIYVKTMGFSQLDRPMFEKFRLVREENTAVASSDDHTATLDAKTINNTFGEVKAEIGRIWSEIKAIKDGSLLSEVKSNAD